MGKEQVVDKSVFISRLGNLDATIRFGRRLGNLLFPGAVVALIGPLGAGKTSLTRAIALGLDIKDSRVVTSPTFVLIQEYDSRLPIYHFDAYRLPGEREFQDLGVHEYFASQGVCVVEWADRVAASLPAERLEISFEVSGETSRVLTLRALGEKYRELIESLARLD